MIITATAQVTEKPSATPVDYRQIAQDVLGHIEWEDGGTTGYCKCPGQHLHTGKNSDKDTMVHLADGRPPTITCFHNSCKPEVDRANTILRSELGKAEARSESTSRLVGRRKLRKPIPDTDEYPDDTERFLTYCFEPGDIVSIECTELIDGQEVPKGAGTNIYPVDHWLEGIRNGDQHPKSYFGGNAHGTYIRINPIERGTHGGNNDVTNYRYTLIESDEGTKEEQEKIIRASKLPVHALIDSGGKSIHAWVHVGAANLQQYHKRRQKLWDALPDGFVIDEQNKNPSRFSRLPGCNRGDQEQKLLALGLGPRDYDEWDLLNDLSEESPEFGPDFLIKYDVQNDPNNVIGNRWLCKGAVFGFVGPTGVGKSTLLMQAVMDWGLGRDFFGIKPIHPLKSYIIQHENDDGDLAEQFQGVAEGIGLSGPEIEMLQEKLIFRNVLKHVGMDLGKLLEYTIDRHEPDILWIDPLMHYVGGDLSDQEYMTEWLSRMILPIAKDTGTIIGLVQHTGKPVKDSRKMDALTGTDLAYQGFGTSIIPNACREMINLSQVRAPDDQPRTFRLDLCKRRNKAGMRNVDGELSNHIYIQHAQKGVCWNLCKQPPAPEKKK